MNHLFYQRLLTGPSQDIGEVWANMLHNVYAALVASHGFSGIAKTNPTSTAGNAVFLHLFLDALALQPCNPTCAYPVVVSSDGFSYYIYQSSTHEVLGFRPMSIGMGV